MTTQHIYTIIYIKQWCGLHTENLDIFCHYSHAVIPA